jgi:hypothetical protein
LATFLLLLVLFRVIEPYGWKMVLISSLLTISGTYFSLSSFWKADCLGAFWDFRKTRRNSRIGRERLSRISESSLKLKKKDV